MELIEVELIEVELIERDSRRISATSFDRPASPFPDPPDCEIFSLRKDRDPRQWAQT